jgi:hypothetical protein
MEAQTLLDFGASACFINQKVGVTIQVGPNKKKYTSFS